VHTSLWMAMVGNAVEGDTVALLATWQMRVVANQGGI